MRLSVCMAVHNEETRIVDVLSRVIDWVDEVVIIDGESTDKTVERARSLGKKVHVFHEKNPRNFIANKQKAIERARGDWTLELDADEQVTAQLKEEILAAIEQKDSVSYLGFRIARLNHFLGKPLWKGGQYPDLKYRLYRTGTARFPIVSVHDEAEPLPEHRTRPIGTLHGHLLHYPYADIGVYLRKTVQYARFEAEARYERGDRPGFSQWVASFIGKPLWWFATTYIRHRGYMDGFPGFVFSLFSSIRYWFEYASLYERSTRA